MSVLVVMLVGCATGVRDTRYSFSKVVIDAGHGGHDPGASSRSGLREKDVALDVALRVDKKLRAAGVATVLTRKDDQFISLGERVRISNSQKSALFVSIHFNYARGSHVHGVETYYYHPYGKDVANRIQTSLVKIGAFDRGVKYGNFHVLRNAKYPAVLTECGFMTNRREEQLIRTAAYRDRLAQQIAKAILEMRKPELSATTMRHH